MRYVRGLFLISYFMYIHGYKSPESKQNSNFKLGHARRKCQAGEKKIKIKLIKNTKWEMKLIFPVWLQIMHRLKNSDKMEKIQANGDKAAMFWAQCFQWFLRQIILQPDVLRTLEVTWKLSEEIGNVPVTGRSSTRDLI